MTCHSEEAGSVLPAEIGPTNCPGVEHGPVVITMRRRNLGRKGAVEKVGLERGPGRQEIGMGTG